MLLQSPLFISLLLCLIPLSLEGPVPIVEEQEAVEEEGFLVLVPTVPVDGKGQPTKREVDYELISIPADVIKRTVREVTNSHHGISLGEANAANPLNQSPGSIFITDLNTNEEDEFIISPGSNSLDTSSTSRQDSTRTAAEDDFLNGISDDDLSSPSTGGNSYSSNNGVNLPVLSSGDLSKILSSVATAGLSAASTGANIAGQAKNVLQTATRVGTSAVVGGTQAVRWVLQKKATGLRTFAEFAGTGLNYAGRLSSAVLKVLLRIPGIKARVVSDLIQAGQPLASAVSNIFSESADDLSDIFNSQTGVFKDAISILFKLITDVLALKGRVLAGFGSGGLDGGANLITAGVKVGSAFVQTAGDVVSAVGRGVGEFMKVAAEVKLPPPPQLPAISFPQLPIITYPKTQSYSSKSSSEETYSSKGASTYS